MCELFAMSGRHPATVSLSLGEFARHGGLTDHHKDGWGIAWYDAGDALLFREPRAAADSPSLDFVRQHDIASKLVMSHIRHATTGEVALRNTQPFARELGGRLHVFAHNGMLADVAAHYSLTGRYLPIGETDSEFAFCVLMDSLAALWTDRDHPPDSAARVDVFARFARDMATLGPANFIYSDGDILVAHGHRRSHSDGIHPPGLHYLCRTCEAEPVPVNVSGLRITTDADAQDIVLLASVPLSDENWTAFAEGEIMMLQGGKIIEAL